MSTLKRKAQAACSVFKPFWSIEIKIKNQNQTVSDKRRLLLECHRSTELNKGREVAEQNCMLRRIKLFFWNAL